MSENVKDADVLQELSERHDEVMAKLDALEEKIQNVLNDYFGKVSASLEQLQDIDVSNDSLPSGAAYTADSLLEQNS
ncbi:MAG: hypothetical protein Q4D38_13095 [Planctomycetia bacterium]|nr:hypothetical protein [Planctomycetia bacterium]